MHEGKRLKRSTPIFTSQNPQNTQNESTDDKTSEAWKAIHILSVAKFLLVWPFLTLTDPKLANETKWDEQIYLE